jgi:hypothetical protein
MQVRRAGWEATPQGAEAGAASRDDLGADVGQAVPSRRPLTLECFREVARRPPLTENQLLGIAGNLCCCLTQVRSPAHHDKLASQLAIGHEVRNTGYNYGGALRAHIVTIWICGHARHDNLVSVVLVMCEHVPAGSRAY